MRIVTRSLFDTPAADKRFDLSFLSLFLLTLVSLRFTQVAKAADIELQKSTFVALPGHKMEVKLDFNAPPPKPKSYMIDSPPRLVMDLWGVSNEMNTKRQDVQTGQVDSLTFAQTNGRLRMVANLNMAVQFRTYAQGNSLFIEFGGSAEQSTVADAQGVAPTPKQIAGERNPAVNDDRTRVQGIDFERGDDGAGRVVITMSDDEAGMDISEEGNNIVVNLAGAALSDALEQRVDVKDFATPVMFIDSMVSGENTTILIKPSSEPYDYMAYQAGNKLIVDVKPLVQSNQQDANANRFPYSGEKIDLNFQDVSVRAVLQIIAEVAKMNLVISDEVDRSAGNITLRLKNVPWDQALDIILKTKGLAKREVGNVLLIGTASEIAAREQQELASQKQEQDLSPLQTEFIQIDYRRASEMKQHIEDAKLISDRGFVLADDQTNVLMIRETAGKIEGIRRTLRNFDVEVAQIMVEARIVTASTDFAKSVGINWGFSAAGSNGQGWSVGSSSGGPGAANSGMMVDLGADSSAGTFAVGYISNNFLLGAELNAMESDGQGEVISQPKVITTNGKPALIKSGQEIPYTTTNGDGDENTEFKDVTLSLEVTPQLNPGDRIALDLKIKQDNVGDTLDNGEIAIDTNQLETSVVVNDGNTIVLGGIFRNEKTDSTTKVPVLGDLPVIGKAFRSRTQSNEKNELLIFITPKLVRESLASQ